MRVCVCAKRVWGTTREKSETKRLPKIEEDEAGDRGPKRTERGETLSTAARQVFSRRVARDGSGRHLLDGGEWRPNGVSSGAQASSVGLGRQGRGIVVGQRGFIGDVTLGGRREPRLGRPLPRSSASGEGEVGVTSRARVGTCFGRETRKARATRGSVSSRTQTQVR